MKAAVIGILAFACIAVFSKRNSGYCQTFPKSACFKNDCVDLEIADTEKKRQLGLMFRKKLGQNSGMLFIFNIESIYGFWMKNMNFPIDIIWIDKDNRIIDVSKDIAPCSENCAVVFPQSKVKYALEVNSGYADRKKIKIGETVNFR